MFNSKLEIIELDHEVAKKLERLCLEISAEKITEQQFFSNFNYVADLPDIITGTLQLLSENKVTAVHFKKAPFLFTDLTVPFTQEYHEFMTPYEVWNGILANKLSEIINGHTFGYEGQHGNKVQNMLYPTLNAHNLKGSALSSLPRDPHTDDADTTDSPDFLVFSIIQNPDCIATPLHFLPDNLDSEMLSLAQAKVFTAHPANPELRGKRTPENFALLTETEYSYKIRLNEFTTTAEQKNQQALNYIREILKHPQNVYKGFTYGSSIVNNKYALHSKLQGRPRMKEDLFARFLIRTHVSRGVISNETSPGSHIKKNLANTQPIFIS